MEEKAEMQKAGEAAPFPEADAALLEKVRRLEQENTALTEAAGQVEERRREAARLEDENAALREASQTAPQAPAQAPAQPEQSPDAEGQKPGKRRKNPLRYEDGMEQQGLVSFFEKK